MKEAGENISVEIQKGMNPPPTRFDDSNSYWVAFKNATDEMYAFFSIVILLFNLFFSDKYFGFFFLNRHLNVTPNVFRAVTDSRFIRDVGV